MERLAAAPQPRDTEALMESLQRQLATIRASGESPEIISQLEEVLADIRANFDTLRKC